jgi:hypothetical protein
MSANQASPHEFESPGDKERRKSIMKNAALQSLLPFAGWSEDRLRDVAFVGGLDPLLPTSFKITETAAAALAAVGLAVGDLWELRTGKRQNFSIDTGHATASLRSTKYLRLDGAKVSTERNSVMGIYPTRDGRWNYLHCNFPNHRAAAMKVLNVPEERRAVAEAVTQWDGLALEEAIIAAGGAGGMARSATGPSWIPPHTAGILFRLTSKMDIELQGMKRRAEQDHA